ncbi:MAG: hypothetical protein N2483_09145 [Burkholderiaceae bacterium]|nr:hypothetical protein [Burkholderiaceae bacterium]
MMVITVFSPFRHWLRLIRGLLLLLVLSIAGQVPAQQQGAETCFGAAGMRCGGFSDQLAFQGVAFCLPAPSPLAKSGICKIHGGSWDHDTCCFANPNGVQCGGDNNSNACQAAWDKSLHRTGFGYYWFRSIDYTRTNATGVIERPLYCATPGSGIHRNDRPHCCSGAASAVPADFWSRLARPSLWRCQ